MASHPANGKATCKASHDRYEKQVCLKSLSVPLKSISSLSYIRYFT